MSTVDYQISGDNPSPLPVAATDAIAAAQAYLSMCQTVNLNVNQNAQAAQTYAAQALAALNAAIAASQGAYKRTVVSDVSYSALNTDIVIEYDTLTASRTITLPAASTCVAGRPITIVDASGSCSASQAISIALTGSDSFVGFSGNLRLTRTGRALQLIPTDANSWIVSQLPMIAQAFTGSGTILGGTEYVGVTSLGAPATLSLPPASSMQEGALLTIADESGSCSSSNAITVARAGSDTIKGLTTIVLQIPYQILQLRSNGSNLWLVQ